MWMDCENFLMKNRAFFDAPKPSTTPPQKSTGRAQLFTDRKTFNFFIYIFFFAYILYLFWHTDIIFLFFFFGILVYVFPNSFISGISFPTANQKREKES